MSYIRIEDMNERADFLAEHIRPGTLLGSDPATSFPRDPQRDYACKMIYVGVNPKPVVLEELTKGYERERELVRDFYDLITQGRSPQDIVAILGVAFLEKPEGHYLIVPGYSTTRALVVKVRPLSKRGRTIPQSRVSA